MADTVLIACKAPGGVVLNLDQSVKTDERGGSKINRGSTTVTLKGWAHPFNKPDPTEGLGGYALTEVPTAFWDAWIATHADFPMLLDKTILPPHRDGRRQAVDHDAVSKMFGPANIKDVAGIKQLDTATP